MNLSGCGSLKSLDGLQGFARLKSLNLSRCVSLKSLYEIEHLDPRLVLSLSGCDHLLLDGMKYRTSVYKEWWFKQLELSETDSASGEDILADEGSSNVRVTSDSAVDDVEAADRLADLSRTDDHESARVTAEALLVASAQSASLDSASILGKGLGGLDVEALLIAIGVASPWKTFDDYLRALGERDRDIVVSRVFKKGSRFGSPDKLEDIADRWNVSRERIRQLESRLKAQADLGIELLQSAYMQAVGNLAPREKHAEVLRTLSTFSDEQEDLVAAIHSSTGPWHEVGSWIASAEGLQLVSEARKTLESQADEHSLLSEEAVSVAVEHLQKPFEEREHLLSEILGLSSVGTVWLLKGTQKARVIAALTHLGRAANKEEISSLADIDVGRIGALLGGIEGIDKVDKYQWGLSEWVDDPYEGALREIVKAIDSHGGSVPVDVLSEELPRRFGIKEASVLLMLRSEAFTVEDGYAKLNLSEYQQRPPESHKDAVPTQKGWGQSVVLDSRHIDRGYSLKVSFDIAYANGVRPGDDLLVPVSGSKSEASVIWRRHETTRSIDVGRLASVLRELRFQPGEDVVVVPTHEEVHLYPSSDAAVVSDGTRDKDENDEDQEPGVSDPLFDLLSG